MLRARTLLLLLPMLFLGWTTVSGQPREARPNYPLSRQEKVVEKLHGQEVADPFRWLENQTSDEVMGWITAQNAFTRAWLDRLPGRAALARRLNQLSQIGTLSVPIQCGGRLFFLRRAGNQDQQVLVVRDLATGQDRVIMNPNTSDPKGTTAIDWFFPSPSGNHVAFGLSTGGTELSVMRVADVANWKLLGEEISRTRACSVAWTPDDQGFYYTRYPAVGSVPAGEESYHRHVFFHKLGSNPDQDAKVFGAGRPKEEWPQVQLSPNGKWLLITTLQGFSQSRLFLKSTESAAAAEDLGAADAMFDPQLDDQNLYIRTNDAAPRFKVMKAALAKPKRPDWTDLVPEREDALEELVRIGDRLVLHYLHRASSRLACVSVAGEEMAVPQPPAFASITGLGGETNGKELYVGYSTFLQPLVISRTSLESVQPEIWAQLDAPGLAAEEYEVQQLMVTSKDKTEVPLFVVHRRGLPQDGKRPTLLYGYGGFAVSMLPRFRESFVPIVEAGGVVAVASLRGGGEFGEAWHQDGMLGKKQNVFDDFIAAAEALIEKKYTSPDKLAILGGSNGGLLVAAAATQRPELFRAVVCLVPLTDMVRYARFGIAQLWIPEYGDPDKPEQFAWLHAYSPYHRVKDGTKYPAFLITAAAGDSRVDPLHACKLAARLQAASTNSRPILLRLELNAGHGAGKGRRQLLAEQTDILSFLFAEWGK